MLKVGITGGIGSGKSTIAQLFTMWGYPVYSADVRSKWLINNDQQVKEDLINTFGKEIYKEELDRKALAAIVFSDKEALLQLNNITHPAVERDFNEWCPKQESSIVFKEAAILFESNTHKSVDKVICVTAPEITRVQRVMKRDNASAKEVMSRIANQWPEDEKIKLSDFVIHADEKRLVITQALDIIVQLKSCLV